MTSGCSVLASCRTVTYAVADRHRTAEGERAPTGSPLSPLGIITSITPPTPHAIAIAAPHPTRSPSNHHASSAVITGIVFCSTVASASGNRASAP